MILVFGSINIDLLVPVAALPRPGETVLGGDYRLLPGGKGANQALAARRAGSAVTMAGAVGKDAFADAALEWLRRDGVDLTLLRQVERSTGLASIMVAADGENLIAVASGANAAVTAEIVPDNRLGPETMLLCQMEVPLAETAALIRRARAHGTPSILNLAPALPIDRDLFRDLDLLVGNQAEAATLGEDSAAIARRLRQAFVVTRGAAGSTAFLADGERLDIPALAVGAVDTTGAGDTFVGVLAAGLDQGLALDFALWRASAAAGLACLAHGAQTAMPDAAAIDAAVKRLPQ
jgi:ribokinase